MSDCFFHMLLTRLVVSIVRIMFILAYESVFSHVENKVESYRYSNIYIKNELNLIILIVWCILHIDSVPCNLVHPSAVNTVNWTLTVLNLRSKFSLCVGIYIFISVFSCFLPNKSDKSHGFKHTIG